MVLIFILYGLTMKASNGLTHSISVPTQQLVCLKRVQRKLQICEQALYLKTSNNLRLRTTGDIIEGQNAFASMPCFA